MCLLALFYRVAEDAPVVLDVRNPGEWKAGHIPGSVNIPLNHLQERIDEIPRDRRRTSPTFDGALGSA